MLGHAGAVVTRKGLVTGMDDSTVHEDGWLEAGIGSLVVALMLVVGAALPGWLDMAGLLDVAGLVCLLALAGVAAWAMWEYR